MFINDISNLNPEESKLYHKALDFFTEVYFQYVDHPEFNVMRGNVSVFRERVNNQTIHDGVIFQNGQSVECYNGPDIDKIIIGRAKL